MGLANYDDMMANEGMVYDFDLGDFGNQLEFDKDELDGKVVIVRGVSESEFTGNFQTPARSLLFNFLDDPKNIDAWGAFFTADSPIIHQAQEMIRKGHVPFYAQIVKVQSQRNRGYTYWTLKRAQMRFNQSGQPVEALADGGKKK